MNAPDSHGVTSVYANPPGGWPAVIEAASHVPQLRRLVENYRRTRHPACLNALMTNAPAEVWLAYHCGADAVA